MTEIVQKEESNNIIGLGRNLDLLAIFSIVISIGLLYFKERNSINIIYLLFFIFILHQFYSIFIQNKNLIKDKKKISHFIIPILKGFDIYAFFIVIFYFLAIILIPDIETAKIFSILFISGIIYVSFRNKKINLSKKPIKTDLNIIISLILIYLILVFLPIISKWRYLNLLEYIDFISPFSNLFLQLLSIFILKSILIIVLNNNLNNKMKFKENIKNINVKKIISFIAIYFIFIAMIVFMILFPTQKPTMESQENCTLKLTYSTSANNKLLNNYFFSIPTKNYSDIQLVFSGILKKDGEYNEINVFNDSRSNIQYYDLIAFNEGKSGTTIIRFYNKNIEYFDKLELITKEEIC